MSQGAIKAKTKNFNFNKINFDFPRWHTYEWDNWDLLDAALNSVGAVVSSGVWQNSYFYAVGIRATNTNNGFTYTCLVAHTTPATGTFDDELAAHPEYWNPVTAVPNYRGVFTYPTLYYAGDIARQGYVYRLATTTTTSSAGSFVDGPNWSTVFDATQAVNDANAAAASAQSNATLVQNLYNDFAAKYLGSSATNPTVDALARPVIVGAMYFNTGTKRLRVYDGTLWVEVLVDAPSDGKTYGRKSSAWVDLATDLAGSTFYTKAQSDTKFVDAAGDTMGGPLSLPVGSPSVPSLNFGVAGTGIYGVTNGVSITINGGQYVQFDNTKILSGVPIVLPSDPSTSLQAATKQYVDNTVNTGVGTGYTKAAADAKFVDVVGDTMTGDLTINKSQPILHLSSTDSGGAGGILKYEQNGLGRWLQHVQGVETGSNAGSTLNLASYNDAGFFLKNIWQIPRATGVVSFFELPTLNGTPTHYESAIGEYNYSNLDMGLPAIGVIRFSDANPVNSTMIYINYTSFTGTLVRHFVQQIGVGTKIWVQDRADATKYYMYQTTGAPVDNGGVCVAITTAYLGGTGPIANGGRVVLGIAGGGGGGASVEISDTPPSPATDKSLWWQSSTGGMFIRYNDGDSSQWVQVNQANGIPEAPMDGYAYGRFNGTWTGVLPLIGGTLTGNLSGQTASFSRAAAGYTVTGNNTSTVDGAGGIIGYAGSVYGICGYYSGGTGYSLYGNGHGYITGNFSNGGYVSSGTGIITTGYVNVGSSVNFTNISNFALGYAGAAGATTGTGGYYWFYSGGAGYQMIPGYFIRAADNSAANGTSSYRWTYVACVSGTINTSDEREKDDIRPISEKEIAVGKKLKPLLIAYKWKDAIEKKGFDGARIHFGIISQRVREVFESEGLDAAAYAVWCEDEIEEYIDPVVETAEDGTQTTISEGYHRKTGEVRYGIRYEQLFALILGAM